MGGHSLFNLITAMSTQVVMIGKLGYINGHKWSKFSNWQVMTTELYHSLSLTKCFTVARMTIRFVRGT